MTARVTWQRLGNNRMALAAILSGPLFLATAAAAMIVDSAAAALPPPSFGDMAWLVPLLVIAECAAIMVASLALLFGRAIMGWLGQWFFGTRLTPAWALAGASMAAAVGVVLDLPAQLAVALALTGGLCAAIARASVRWSDG